MLSVNRCPECGREFDPDDPSSYRRRPYLISRRTKWITAIVLVLFAYAGTYLAMVEVGKTTSPNRRTHPTQFLYFDPTYRVDDRLWEVVFAPAYYADKHLRRERWTQPVWQARHWSYPHHPRGKSFAHRATLDGVEFRLDDPTAVQVWTMRFKPVINIDTHPIVTMRYRAVNTDPGPGWYSLWIDDGTGPSAGGLIPFTLTDIQGDGQVHEIQRDLRLLSPQGNLFWFAVAMASGPGGNATFELIELRFESIDVLMREVADD
jgi:hypothetical protein